MTRGRAFGSIAFALLVGALALFPWLGDLTGARFPTSYEIRLVLRGLILAIVAIGLNLLVGFAGLISLGQAALYGLGAHVAALLSLRAEMGFLGATACAVLVPALFGVLLAFPTVRVRGVYLAVITIAFGLIFVNVLREWVSVTGGASGLPGLPRPTVFGTRLLPTRAANFNYYYTVLGFFVLAVWAQWAIATSRFGRAMRAVAESENAARTLGIDATAIRTLAFTVSAGFAGLAGSLFANLALYVNYETFTFTASVELLLMVILGGAGTLAGPVVGTAVLFSATQALQGFGQWQTFAYGALLAAVLFLMPRGIVGSVAALWRGLGAAAGVRADAPWPQWGHAPAVAEGGVELAVEGVCLRFGGLAALNAVSMRVAPGTVHGLIGPNGAGKSSLLNVVSGFYRAGAGEVRVDGVPVGGRAAHRLARLGIARTFQNTELFGRMTVRENVLIGAHRHFRSGLIETLLRLPRARREERAAQAMAEELLAFVGLAGFAEEEARNLPFGHQRRLEIARALALRPRLLLLDEPAAGLTQGEIERLSALIRGLADRGITVVLVEHHVEMVMSLCDRVTVLDYGEVIADGPPAAVQADPAVIEAYFGAADPLARAAEARA